MKKLFAIILCALMMSSFTSCKKDKAEMYCYNCGEGISKDVSYCSYCGTNVKGYNSVTETITELTTVLVELTTEHQHEYSKEITPATCSEKGFTTYICSCGDLYKDDYVNPSHKFVDYVCKECQAIDKSNAYGYLLQWIKTHGSVRDDMIGVSEKVNDNLMCHIIYNTTTNYLYVYCTDDIVNFKFELDLRSRNGVYEVKLDRKVQSVNIKTYGTIKGKSFSDDSSATITEYTGGAESREMYGKLLSSTSKVALSYLEGFLESNVPGITLYDLGFKAF